LSVDNLSLVEDPDGTGEALPLALSLIVDPDAASLVRNRIDVPPSLSLVGSVGGFDLGPSDPEDEAESVGDSFLIFLIVMPCGAKRSGGGGVSRAGGVERAGMLMDGLVLSLIFLIGGGAAGPRRSSNGSCTGFSIASTSAPSRSSNSSSSTASRFFFVGLGFGGGDGVGSRVVFFGGTGGGAMADGTSIVTDFVGLSLIRTGAVGPPGTGGGGMSDVADEDGPA
jgi:hypothetical protein